MTREDEILNSMREQREDAYRDGLEQGKAFAVEKMLAAGMTAEEIAEILN